MDKKQVKAIADTEVKKHETRMHKGKAFKKGGPTTDDRMRLGRNLSRAASQKTG